MESKDNLDIDNIKQWQQDSNPAALAKLVMRYQPVVNSVVNKYKTTGVSVPTLRAKASTQLLKALGSYDVSKGASPTTHIWNNLQKVQRIAGESLQSGHIPEYRSLKKSTFTTIRDNMIDRLGYEPSVKEMADELSWSQKEVSRMNSELNGETTASGADFDFYGNSVTGESRDMELVNYMYHDLNNKDKVIVEHTFGLGGKKILNNKLLAKKLKTNEMNVHRSKKRLADNIREYR